MILVDILLIISLLILSFSIRLGYWYVPENNLLMIFTFISPLIAIPIFYYFGLYTAVIRFFELKALWSVFKSVTLYSLVWGLMGFMITVGPHVILPRSVTFINWALCLIAIGGVRLGAYFILSRNLNYVDDVSSSNSNKKLTKYDKQLRVLIYGSIDAGIQLVSALENSQEFQTVGFINDSENLNNQNIRGLKVFPFKNIEKVIDKLMVDEILLVTTGISRTKRLAILTILEQHPVSVRLIPGVSELAQGNINLDGIRNVNVNDLLGRNEVLPNREFLEKNIFDKVVLVTGAGGSIGSELCRQVLKLKPKGLILFEISELALYNIEKELSNKSDHEVDIYPVLGSILDITRLRNVFKYFDIQTVYHAAAYKHVPMVEFNNSEGANNNIIGTLNCAHVSIENNVDTFVLVSTDKAVRPTNTMGATKRAAEMILQALSKNQNSTTFSMVRFGNVLDSSGSVIPLFKQQIKDGGPITVTHKDIIRYFMTITEAVELVIQAGAISTGGDVFLIDMGKPVRIVDLAEKMISLSGLSVMNESNPEGDIEITYTGLRPGEKLFEELLIGNDATKTANPLIMRAEEQMLFWDDLKPLLDLLEKAIENSNQDNLREILLQIVPEFNPQSEISDILHKKI